jgi:hypothetical protein
MRWNISYGKRHEILSLYLYLLILSNIHRISRRIHVVCCIVIRLCHRRRHVNSVGDSRGYRREVHRSRAWCLITERCIICINNMRTQTYFTCFVNLYISSKDVYMKLIARYNYTVHSCRHDQNYKYYRCGSEKIYR